MITSVEQAAPALRRAPEAQALPLEFSRIYDAWFDEVVRWLPAMGAAEADVEDLAQEVFLVVERKLHRFDGRNLSAWLYGIGLRVVLNYRRLAWFRNVFSRPNGAVLDELRDDASSPAELLERKEARLLLSRLLERMSEKRRRALVLFEVEGYSGEEIAMLEGVPVATIWSRLHQARRDFVTLVTESRREGRA
jgi:RNA polymerase sigma-70 factor (ECF subfamily)